MLNNLCKLKGLYINYDLWFWFVNNYPLLKNVVLVIYTGIGYLIAEKKKILFLKHWCFPRTHVYSKNSFHCSHWNLSFNKLLNDCKELKLRSYIKTIRRYTYIETRYCLMSDKRKYTIIGRISYLLCKLLMVKDWIINKRYNGKYGFNTK